MDWIYTKESISFVKFYLVTIPSQLQTNNQRSTRQRLLEALVEGESSSIRQPLSFWTRTPPQPQQLSNQQLPQPGWSCRRPRLLRPCWQPPQPSHRLSTEAQGAQPTPPEKWKYQTCNMTILWKPLKLLSNSRFAPSMPDSQTMSGEQWHTQLKIIHPVKTRLLKSVLFFQHTQWNIQENEFNCLQRSFLACIYY